MLSSLPHHIANEFPVGCPPLVLSRYPQSDGDETAFFAGKRWNELSATELRANSDAVSYFTTEALTYFTPAYMLAYLVDAEALDMAVESFLLNLGGTSDRTSPEFERARSVRSLFSESQRRVVAAFLRHYSQVEGSCADPIVAEALHVYAGISEVGF